MSFRSIWASLSKEGRSFLFEAAGLEQRPGTGRTCDADLDAIQQAVEANPSLLQEAEAKGSTKQREAEVRCKCRSCTYVEGCDCLYLKCKAERVTASW